MSISVAVLAGPVQLGTSAAALYTAPANTHAVVKRAVFTNVTGGSVTITVYVVRSGGTAGATNEIIATMPLTTLQAYVSPELASMTLNPGDSIQALASAGASINAVMSGFTL